MALKLFITRSEWRFNDVLAAVIGAAFIGFFLLTNEKPPIRGGITLEVLNSPIHQGEVLLVRSHRHKERGDCPVSSFRQATNQDGKVFQIPARVWEGGSPSEAYVDLVFDTTALPPGSYTGVATAFYTCPRRTFEYNPPPFRFRVSGPGVLERLQMQLDQIQIAPTEN